MGGVIRWTVVALAFGASAAQAKREVVLWHSYRAAEERALGTVVEQFEAQYPDFDIRVLAVPHDVFPSKLTASIPRGHGPDLFIFAHERIGSWAGTVVAPLSRDEVPVDFDAFFPRTLEALTYEGELYGLPLAYKSVALFYNRALVDVPPATTDELIALARALSEPDQGRFGLVWPTDEFYFHAPWLFGFGGSIFDAEGRPRLDTAPIARSLAFVRRLTFEDRVVPQEANTALATRLFNEGTAGMVINGPWFIGEIDPSIDYGIAVLPVVSETGRRATPFLTVEAALVSAHARDREGAILFASFLAAEGGAAIRALEGRQAVAFAPAYDDPRIAGDPVLAGFRAQLPFTVLTSNRPEMRAVWEPAKGALKAVLRGEDPVTALARAQQRLRANVREPPPPADPAPYLLVVGLFALVAAGLWVRAALRPHPDGHFFRRVRRGSQAYAYLAPAFAGLLFLVLVPFTVGLAIAFTHYDGSVPGDLADKFTFVGLANFSDILFGQSYGPTDPLSFYFTLVVTMLWTVLNVVLHVTLGIALAMVLKAPWLRLRGVYRALLIIPWAVPNYITALIWKGMFHKQFGAVNEVLGWFGIEPVGWFSSFWTAFAANVTTNTWLGFPFMMVVALGALQSIPDDLYEAADVDGATAWQRFRHITLPLLRPAMMPAVLLGMIWTFNMFNIVYLVSGGEPDGSTDILISEAYRWAFERQEQYGYAAAYATLIFCILVGYTLATRRLAGGEELV